MSAGSLRLRLILGSAIWVIGSLCLTGLALSYLFTRNVEQGLEEELQASHNRLLAVISPEGERIAREDALPDPSYMTPFSGRYWQIEDLDSGEIIRSRSLWDTVMLFPTPNEPSLQKLVTIPGPDGQSLAAISHAMDFQLSESAKRLRVSVAQDRAILDRSIERFRIELSAALLIVGTALIVASWAQVNLSLSPLRALARSIEVVRKGTAERVSGDYPKEVMPLVNEVNDLLDARERSIDSARARASDLAHGLKTPISVMSATANSLRATGDTENADALEALSEEMSDRIDYQLRLIRLRPRTSSQILRASLNEALLRTVSVLRKTQSGESLHWVCELGPDLTVDIDGHDLLELAGIILENASKWATSRVEVSTQVRGAAVDVFVDDDGPGLTDEQIAKLGIRGQRLDESRPGSGLGLAIAKEILAVNSGSIGFERSDHGGLRAILRLPVPPNSNA